MFGSIFLGTTGDIFKRTISTLRTLKHCNVETCKRLEKNIFNFKTQDDLSRTYKLCIKVQRFYVNL